MKELGLVALIILIACLGVGGARYVASEVYVWEDWREYRTKQGASITFETYKKLKQGRGADQ